ncbi:unnamed protein product [Paramecium primaurelia]|uniref:Transmembrane protein n=1 Tax=Paramecium primaurelia TaxID=5886 RepID=A0A8S1QQD6_PARPR|nr:unnamed protein product [Paramecium primaurelia]
MQYCYQSNVQPILKSWTLIFLQRCYVEQYFLLLQYIQEIQGIILRLNQYYMLLYGYYSIYIFKVFNNNIFLKVNQKYLIEKKKFQLYINCNQQQENPILVLLITLPLRYQLQYFFQFNFFFIFVNQYISNSFELHIKMITIKQRIQTNLVDFSQEFWGYYISINSVSIYQDELQKSQFWSNVALLTNGGKIILLILFLYILRKKKSFNQCN